VFVCREIYPDCFYPATGNDSHYQVSTFVERLTPELFDDARFLAVIQDFGFDKLSTAGVKLVREVDFAVPVFRCFTPGVTGVFELTFMARSGIARRHEYIAVKEKLLHLAPQEVVLRRIGKWSKQF